MSKNRTIPFKSISGVSGRPATPLSFFGVPRGIIPPWRRLVATTLVTWPMLGLYQIIDFHQLSPPTAVPMPSWVPFWPALTLPYLAMLPVTWLLPVAIRDAARFRACLWAMVCAYLLVAPWWLLAPTTLPRPPLPEGSWAFPYQWLVACDPPNNVSPCAHGIGPVVAAWFAARDRPAWRWPLAAMVVLGLPPIALIWQHRPLDILLGTMAAAAGIAVGEALNRRERTQILNAYSL
jgi:hypothetical protein